MSDVPIRPASTIVVLRDSPTLEVLLLQRRKRDGSASPVWVFPGGAVEEQDQVPSGCEDDAARLAGVRETREEAAIQLDLDNLEPYAHWTTPEGGKKRYSTWFFLADDPGEQVTVDQQEIADYCWLSPAEALARQASGEMTLLPPTFVTLTELSAFSHRQAARQALAKTAFNTILPMPTIVEDGVCMLYPGDAGYETVDAHAPGPRHRFWMMPDGWRYEKALTGDPV